MIVRTVNGSAVDVCQVGERKVSELERYQNTGYTPEEIVELEAKYWMCNMQIALYDDELRLMRNILGYM